MPAVGQIPLLDPLRMPSGTSLTTHTIDAANDKIALVMTAPADIDITDIGIYCSAVTGSSPTYAAGFFEVDSSGNPTTNPLNGLTGGQFVPTAGAFASSTLFDPVSLSYGTQFAVVIQHSSGTINGSNNATFAAAAPFPASLSLLTPRAMLDTAGVWSTVTGLPLICLMTDASTILGGFSCVSAVTSHATWNTGSTDVSRGNKWVPGYSGRICGFNILGDFGTAWDFNLRVYLNNVLVVDFTVDVSAVFNDPAASTFGFVPCQVSFVAGDTIRVVMTPQVPATNPTAVSYWSFPSQAALTAFANANICGTSGTTTPVWTDYNSGGNGFRLYPIIPVIDQITTSGGTLLGSSLVR